MTKNEELLGLRRGMAALEAVARAGATCTFSEIQGALGLPATTVSRVLRVLVDEGVLEKVAGHGPYQTGQRLKDLANVISTPRTRQEALQPILNELSQITGETSCYFDWAGDCARLVAKVEALDSVHVMAVGGENRRIFRNGFGQVSVAQISKRERTRLLEGGAEGPAIGERAFAKRMTTIRQEGVLIERGEAKSTFLRVVSPVFKGDAGEFVGALGICMFAAADAEPERWIAQVKEAALRTTHALAAFDTNSRSSQYDHLTETSNDKSKTQHPLPFQ